MLSIAAIMVAIGWLTASICVLAEEDILAWAEDRGFTVSRIERHFTWVGTPFWYLQYGAQIFEVETTDGQRWWIRTSILGWDVVNDSTNNDQPTVE